jgi:hypothetical protein
MKTKPITPYQRLLEICREYASKVEYRHRRHMFTYPIASLNAGNSFLLGDLHQRSIAADALGYCIEVTPTDKGLEVWYVKRVPERPMELTY